MSCYISVATGGGKGGRLCYHAVEGGVYFGDFGFSKIKPNCTKTTVSYLGDISESMKGRRGLMVEG